MRGIPRALGCITYLSVWREVGALCVERLVVFLPSLPTLCFPLCISVTGACPFWGHGGSWLGCQVLPAIGHWSWLPIVEAPGCFGHPTSKERRCCLLVNRGGGSGELKNLQHMNKTASKSNQPFCSPLQYFSAFVWNKKKSIIIIVIIIGRIYTRGHLRRPALNVWP